MLIINGNAMLRIDGKVRMPGEEIEIDEKTGKKLVGVGLATAMVEPKEKATMPRGKPRKKGKRG